MSQPVIFVVHDEPATLESVATALERRFGADYRIVTDADPDSALVRLGDACQRGAPVALVLAGVSSLGASGLDWLGRVRALCPWTSRCALMSYGDEAIHGALRRALAQGQLDTFLLTPVGDPEQRLYPVVAEILGAWARTVRPGPPVVTIVGER